MLPFAVFDSSEPSAASSLKTTVTQSAADNKMQTGGEGSIAVDGEDVEEHKMDVDGSYQFCFCG